MATQERLMARTARLTELGRSGLSNEAIRDVLAEEFTDLKPITARTVAAKLWTFGIPAHSEPAPERMDIDQWQGEMQKLRDENTSLRQQRTMALRERNYFQAIRQTLREGLQDFPPVPEVYRYTSTPSTTPQSLVLWTSCLHYGEFVSPAETFGLGEYGLDMAAARMEYLGERAIDLALNHHSGEQFHTVYLVIGGDNISGFIHPDLVDTNLLPMGKQQLFAGLLWYLLVRDLAAHFNHVKVIGVVGNHPRLYRKPRFKGRVWENIDASIYAQIALMAQNTPDMENVEVILPEAFFHVEQIENRNFFFGHGDNVRAWMNIPHYGFDRMEGRLTELLLRNDVKVNYWCWAHYHTAGYAQKPNGARIMTGSFKGPDEFAMTTLGTGNDPMQMIFGVHPKHGTSFHYPLEMTRATPDVQKRFLIPAASSVEEVIRWSKSVEVFDA